MLDDGIASHLGSGAAYFLRPTEMPTQCRRRQALTLRKVAVDRLNGPGSFDIGRWQGSGSTRYGLSAEDGRLFSSQPASLSCRFL